MKKVLSFILVIAVAFTSLGLEGGKAYAQEDVVVGEQPYYEITMFVTEDDLKDEHHIDLTEYLDKQITAFVDTNFKVFYIKEVHEKEPKIFLGGTIKTEDKTIDFYDYYTNYNITTGGAITTPSSIQIGKLLNKTQLQNNNIYTLIYQGETYTLTVSPTNETISPGNYILTPGEIVIVTPQEAYDPSGKSKTFIHTVTAADVFSDRSIVIDGTSYKIPQLLIVFREIEPGKLVPATLWELQSGDVIKVVVVNGYISVVYILNSKPNTLSENITSSTITSSVITSSAITGSAIVYGKVKEIQKSQDVSMLTLTSNNKDFYLWTTSDSDVLKSISANDNNNYEFKIDSDGKIDEFRIAETEMVYDPDLDYRVITRTINDKDIYDDRLITLNDDGKETIYAVSSAGLIVFKEVKSEVFTTGTKNDLTTGKHIEIHLKNNTVLFIKIRL